MKGKLLIFCLSVLISNLWPLFTLLLSPFVILFFAAFKTKYLPIAYVFLLGALWVFWNWTTLNEASLTLEQGRQSWQLIGKVGQVSSQTNRTEFDFYPEGPFKKLKVSCYHCPWVVGRGDRWALALRLKPFTSFYNPVMFDYRKWMLARGYAGYGSINVKHSYNHKIKNSAFSLPKQINITLSERHFPILRALLLGDKKTLPAKYRRIINGSGLGHLFVVSGLHVGMMALIVTLFLAWIQRGLLLGGWTYGPTISVLGGFSAALFYAYLSGFNTPVIRACIMLLFGFLMMFRSKNSSVGNYLLAALLCVVLINPLAFMGLGSWLSFVIVGFLIFGMSLGASKLKKLVAAQQLAFLSGGVVLVLAGMTVAPVGLMLNLVFIPLVTLLVLPIAVLGLALALLGFDRLLMWVELCLNSILNGLIEFTSVVTWQLPVHDDNQTLFLLAFLVLILPQALKFRWLGVVLVAVSLALPAQRPGKGGFELTVLDVGQGSSALIETSSYSLLVDTGTRYMSGMTLADYVVMPFLRSRGIHRLDILHITHGDLDHSGGQVLLAGHSLEVVDQDHCHEARWVWDGVIFERFKALGFNTGNNGSCLLRVIDALGREALITGDIESAAEKALLEQGGALAADVLIVPHHGSKTSSSPEFLEAVSPKLAIISAGNLNHYGHPHSEIVQRLNSKAIEVYSTASHGAIQVDFDPRQEGLSVSTYRPIFK
jgi:competence protein ComEC